MAPAAEPQAAATITFGSDATNYESVHAASYKGLVGSAAAISAEEKKDLRAHHFFFGTDQAFEPPEKGETCSRSAFRDPGKEYFKAYALQQGEKNDQEAALRRASFTLGSDEDPDRFKSEYHLGTSEPGRTPRKEKTRICDPAKSINISLGSDPVDYKSTAAVAHVDLNDRVVPAIVDLKERTQALRRSSFSFGTDAVDYVTNAGETYSARGFAEAVKKAWDEKHRGEGGYQAGAETKSKRNVLLGFESISYDSEARRSFSQEDALYAHCRDPTKLDAEKKKDLRSHHFEFGADPPTYTSLGRASYSARSRDPAEVRKQAEDLQNAKKDLRSTHICLGQIGNNVLQNQTCSQGAYRAYTARELRQGGLDRKGQEKDVRGVHFILGDDDAAQKQARSISLAQETMKQGVSGAAYENNASQNAEAKATLRKSNFYLGNENSEKWCSTAAASYVSHDDAERSVTSAEAKAALRASHFQLGRDGARYPKDMKSTSQDMMVHHAPTPREQKQGDSIRPHEVRNFVFGHAPVEYQSTYKGGFIWYGQGTPRQA